MSYELEFDDIIYDTGYGEHSGTVIVEVVPVFEDGSFDVYGQDGTLIKVDSRELTDFEFEGATIFVYDNDGGVLMELELDLEDLEKLGIDGESIFQDLNRYVE